MKTYQYNVYASHPSYFFSALAIMLGSLPIIRPLFLDGET